jgi:hypothetical protein
LAASTRRFEPAVAAALFSAGAAAIHASAAGPHFAHWVPFGALFVLTALAQAAWAALVLTAPSARLLAAGAIGNAGVVAVWAASRTVGLPVGPDAWTPEPVAALDLAATSFEIVVVAASVLLLAAGGPYLAVSGRAATRFATAGAVAIAALISAVYAGTPSGGHQHQHAAAAGGAAATIHDHSAAATKHSRRAAGPKKAVAKRTKPAKRPVRSARAAEHAHAHEHARPHAH